MRDGTPVDVPGTFELEADVMQGGDPPRVLIGKVSDAEHVLAGSWVMLAFRSHIDRPAYNLGAFRNRPLWPPNVSDIAFMTGFVELVL